MADGVLRVCALYPDLMNIYADRGNLLLLERRCEWRGIGFELRGAGLGDEIDPDAHDLFYLGGGQDRDQQLCALDLATVKRDALHAAAERGRVIFAVCGGYQLLGHAYELGGERLPGVGLVDLETVREDGAAADRQRRHRGRPGRRPAGARRASRTTAGGRGSGRRATPLGRVLRGHGNNGQRRPRGRPRRRARHGAWAPISTVRCSRRTRGSPTGSPRPPWAWPRARCRRSRTRWRTPHTQVQGGRPDCESV